MRPTVCFEDTIISAVALAINSERKALTENNITANNGAIFYIYDFFFIHIYATMHIRHDSIEPAQVLNPIG